MKTKIFRFLMFNHFFILKNFSKSYCEKNENNSVNTNDNLKSLENSKSKDKNGIKDKEIKDKRKINVMNNVIDITEYKIDENKLKNVIDKVNKVKEEYRIFIQSDTEGKVFNINSTLQIAKIIDINKPINIYYNFENGKFENNKSENSICLKLFAVNKNFKGTYIHLGDIVDRCTGNHQCLKSLLYLLYLKQELGEKVNLICGNHELTDYFKCGNVNCDCCYDIRDYITLIVFKAISNGQIKYLDKIKIGTTDYILTHKIIYKKDIDQIKYFLKNKMNEKTDLKNYDIIQLINVVNDNYKK